MNHQRATGMERNDGSNIYIDECERIYKDWDDFLKNNKYSDGSLVFPKYGIYRDTDNPELDNKNQIKSVIDCGQAAFILSLPALVYFENLRIPAVAAASIAILYKDVFALVACSQHGQTLSLANTQARDTWLHVIMKTTWFLLLGFNMSFDRTTSIVENIGSGFGDPPLEIIERPIASHIEDYLRKFFFFILK